MAFDLPDRLREFLKDPLPDRQNDWKIIGGLAAVVIGAFAYTTYAGPEEQRAQRGDTAVMVGLLAVSGLGLGKGAEKMVKVAAGKARLEGLLEGEARGIEIGYQIPNPDLDPARKALVAAQAVHDAVGDRLPERIAGPLGKGLDIAEAVLPGWADPVPNEEVDAPELPAGWEIDENGRLRDEHGRYAKRPA